MEKIILRRHNFCLSLLPSARVSTWIFVPRGLRKSFCLSPTLLSFFSLSLILLSLSCRYGSGRRRRYALGCLELYTARISNLSTCCCCFAQLVRSSVLRPSSPVSRPFTMFPSRFFPLSWASSVIVVIVKIPLSFPSGDKCRTP